MKKYKHIFFDLDRTLWDFETSAEQTFREIYMDFGLKAKGIPDYESFNAAYQKYNEELWALYRRGEILKEILRDRRFKLTLEHFGYKNDLLAAEIGDAYVTRSPRKVNLFPYTYEILEYLKPSYKLHIITNGFEEVQATKMSSAKLYPYFDQVITSEQAGHKKPHPRIFDFALSKTGALLEESIIIGDDLGVDIEGAINFGMDYIWVNHTNEVNPGGINEVRSLAEIRDIL